MKKEACTCKHDYHASRHSSVCHAYKCIPDLRYTAFALTTCEHVEGSDEMWVEGSVDPHRCGKVDVYVCHKVDPHRI